jgi:predicted enzyme related to lactoylglutathione lyase
VPYETIWVILIKKSKQWIRQPTHSTGLRFRQWILPAQKKFYETIFNIQMMDMPEMMGMKMAGFPAEMGSGKANGALAQSPMHKPSMDGCVIYLNANPDIDAVINRIEGAGGKIVMPKTSIGKEIGNMAFFVDTEGNKMGLHAGPVK